MPRYAAVPRTSSIGDAAAATSAPKRAAASPASSSERRRERLGLRARIGVGPAEPMHVPTRPSDRSSANEQHRDHHRVARAHLRELLRARSPRGIQTAAISSSSASVLRFGPVDELVDRDARAPRTDAISTSAPLAYSGGSASPAGDEDPRFPPIVPRLRICGEPTVRDAIASPGNARRARR